VGFKVKITPEVRGALGQSGLDRAGLLRLYLRLRERLEDAPEAVRAKRSLKDPDCFVFQMGLSGPDANHWFHFLVNDRAEAGVLTVQNVVCERRPKPEEE
jgi:hypothetical protein